MLSRKTRRFIIALTAATAALLASSVPALADDCAWVFSCIGNGGCLQGLTITEMQIYSEGNGNGVITGYMDGAPTDDLWRCSFNGQFPPEGSYVVDPTTGLMQSSAISYDANGNRVVVGTGNYYDPANGYVSTTPPAPPEAPKHASSLSDNLPGLNDTGSSQKSEDPARIDQNPSAEPSQAPTLDNGSSADSPENYRGLLNGITG